MTEVQNTIAPQQRMRKHLKKAPEKYAPQRMNNLHDTTYDDYIESKNDDDEINHQTGLPERYQTHHHTNQDHQEKAQQLPTHNERFKQ